MQQQNDLPEWQRQVLDDLLAERQRQDEQWGPDRRLGSGLWMLITGEEFGEIGDALVESPQMSNLYEEIVQTAAVLVCWAEQIERHPNFVPSAGERSEYERPGIWYILLVRIIGRIGRLVMEHESPDRMARQLDQMSRLVADWREDLLKEVNAHEQQQ